MTSRVLLLGPDDDARRALHYMLDRAGHPVVALAELEPALRYLAEHEVAAVIASEALAPGVVGPGRPAVVGVLRAREVAPALALLEAGVASVVSEPIDELAVTLALREAARHLRTAAPTSAHPTRALVGEGAAMQQLRALIERVATTKTTVLILGESGTGKELVARAIHEASPRRERRFVAINCAAIPANLLESELFGHVKGAFTDAGRDRAGLFEEASGGTLFLDEVGELPLPLQAKLLRALQEGEIRRVGDSQSIKVDVRLIAATLRELADEVAGGRFREDLYYRLAVLPIRVPPLRERREDIAELARFFAERHAERHGLARVELPAPVIAALAAQPWPGNVRELENVVERALVLADGPTIDLAFLATVMTMRSAAPTGEGTDELSIKKASRDLERTLIGRALAATSGNRTNAAKLLEISHRALLYKMKEYGIS